MKRGSGGEGGQNGGGEAGERVRVYLTPTEANRWGWETEGSKVSYILIQTHSWMIGSATGIPMEIALKGYKTHMGSTATELPLGECLENTSITGYINITWNNIQFGWPYSVWLYSIRSEMEARGATAGGMCWEIPSQTCSQSAFCPRLCDVSLLRVFCQESLSFEEVRLSVRLSAFKLSVFCRVFVFPKFHLLRRNGEKDRPISI